MVTCYHLAAAGLSAPVIVEGDPPPVSGPALWWGYLGAIVSGMSDEIRILVRGARAVDTESSSISMEGLPEQCLSDRPEVGLICSSAEGEVREGGKLKSGNRGGPLKRVVQDEGVPIGPIEGAQAIYSNGRREKRACMITSPDTP